MKVMWLVAIAAFVLAAACEGEATSTPDGTAAPDTLPSPSAPTPGTLLTPTTAPPTLGAAQPAASVGTPTPGAAQPAASVGTPSPTPIALTGPTAQPTPTTAPVVTSQPAATPSPTATPEPSPTAEVPPPPEEIPPFPTIFDGVVFIGEAPAPAGFQIIACVDGCEQGWESESVTTTPGGEYRNLFVAPAQSTYVDKEVTFFLITDGDTVQAAETSTFSGGMQAPIGRFDLHFPTLPVSATPTPTPVVPGFITSSIVDFALDNLVITVGTTVTWQQNHNSIHTVTSTDRLVNFPSPNRVWDSDILSQGQAFSRTFNEEGTILYFCRIHPSSMQATIVVQPAASGAGDESTEEY